MKGLGRFFSVPPVPGWITGFPLAAAAVAAAIGGGGGGGLLAVSAAKIPIGLPFTT